MDWLTEARSWVGALVGVVIAWITATWAAKGKKIETTAAPYDKLAERVVKLETQVGQLRAKIERLEDERSDLRDLIRDLFGFVEQHVPPSVPRPFLRPPWLD